MLLTDLEIKDIVDYKGYEAFVAHKFTGDQKVGVWIVSEADKVTLEPIRCVFLAVPVEQLEPASEATKCVGRSQRSLPIDREIGETNEND
jgi:hypothetical protein